MAPNMEGIMLTQVCVCGGVKGQSILHLMGNSPHFMKKPFKPNYRVASPYPFMFQVSNYPHNGINRKDVAGRRAKKRNKQVCVLIM
jgi:hypothetical protein